MGEIHKFTRGDVTLFPATITDAVVHPQVKATISDMVTEFNVSKLFPTSGSNGGSNYTLQGAISILYDRITTQHRVPGLKVIFTEVEKSEPQEWRYLGGVFTNPINWAREDSWYVELNEEVENIDANLISDTLRKSEQFLTLEEKSQVKTNLDLELDVKKINWAEDQNVNHYKTPGVYIITGYKYRDDNIPIEYESSDIKIFATLTVSKIPNIELIGQTITILSSNSEKIETYSRTYDNTYGWHDWNSFSTESKINLGNNIEKLNKLTESTTYTGYFPNYDSILNICDGLSDKAKEVLKNQSSYPYKLENKIAGNTCTQTLTVFLTYINRDNLNDEFISNVAKELILIRLGQWIDNFYCDGEYIKGYYQFNKFTSLTNNDITPQIYKTSSSHTENIYPYKYYVWNDNPTSLYINLVKITDNNYPNVVNKYEFQFCCGDNATSLSVKFNDGTDVIWCGGEPTLSPQKIYQVSIVNGLATITEFEQQSNLPPLTTTTTDDPENTNSSLS